MSKDPCRIIVPGRGLYMGQILRLEYPRDEHGAISTEEYKTAGCRVLISKKDRATLKKIRDAVDAASRKKFGGKVVVREGRAGYPLLDGDEALEDDIEGKKGDEFANHYYLNCKSFNRIPGIVDSDGAEVDDPDERTRLCVSGYYYKFSITFKGSDRGTNRVRCELNNLMFVKEGPRLDGGISAEEEDWSDDGDDDEDDSRSSRRSRRSSRRRRSRD